MKETLDSLHIDYTPVNIDTATAAVDNNIDVNSN